MSKLVLGSFSSNLEKLIDTRLIVQANSGGGKSFAIRKLLEESHGKVQQIVLDIEGDFASLREKFDFVLAGKGGDIPADPKSAELLARKALELNTDLIVDLYELKQPERILFVKNFLESMINAPKNLWHPVLIVLDEAHIFAPEKGNAISLSAVIDMATRGRKRGFCLALATQRLSKLHKDAAAECNNKLIGRTGLDIDLKRAGDELGLSDTRVLRTLEPGEFFAYGPSFTDGVNRVRIGDVKTRHPEAGKRGFKHVPQPTKKVREILKKLSDLPQEVKEDLHDREQLRARVKELESSLKKNSEIGISVKDRENMQRKAQAVADIAIERYVKEARKQMQADVDKKLKTLRDSILVAINKVTEIQGPSKKDFKEIRAGQTSNSASLHHAYQEIKLVPPVDRKLSTAQKALGSDQLGICERKILAFLKVKNGQSFTKVQVGAMTGYAYSSGGFNNALSRLNSMGFIRRSGGLIDVTSGGLVAIEGYPDLDHKLSDWINKLGACERKIYETVLADPTASYEKTVLAELTGYASGSGGFNNALSRLNTLGLIQRNQGMIQLNPEIQLG